MEVCHLIHDSDSPASAAKTSHSVKDIKNAIASLCGLYAKERLGHELPWPAPTIEELERGPAQARAVIEELEKALLSSYRELGFQGTRFPDIYYGFEYEDKRYGKTLVFHWSDLDPYPGDYEELMRELGKFNPKRVILRHTKYAADETYWKTTQYVA